MNAEIIYESGNLLEFIGGNSPSTAYDNYVSHVSEGIVSPGYNDYGPDWVDVQTNGFGNYRIIPQFDYTLQHWRYIFQALLEGDLAAADQMLADSISTFRYELVEFQDLLYGRTYYMIREILDMSYVDPNQLLVAGDEVTGSFANGWGLYILNPNATRQQVVVEIPHPCDDFISPYLGTEMFLQTDAFALLLAGAGREVRWNGDAPYNNNKSLSDPSRIDNSVFQVFHEVLSDSLVNIGPHSPLVIHTHSFDDNGAHEGFQSIVLSGGWDAGNANKPIRDLSDDNLDLVNFTSEYPIAAGAFGDHPALRVDDYYRVHYNGSFLYHGEFQNYPMPHTYTLLGPNTGVQMNYLRQFFDNGEVYEPWVQVELFEKPQLFQDLDMPLTDLYAGTYPTSFQNFSILMDYYQHFIEALEAYLSNWESEADITAPQAINNWRTTYDGRTYVNLEWDPVFDTNHKTYRIFFDDDSITEASPYLDRSSDIRLSNPSRDHFIFGDLDPDSNYVFKIQALDHFDNIGPLSEAISDSLPGHEPIHILENFDAGEIILESYLDEDIDPDSWDLDPDRTFMSSPYSLNIWGNTWKIQTIAPYLVESSAVFQIAAYVEHLGEVQGIAFQDSLNTLFYSLDGTQQMDIEEWVTVYQGYFPEETWNLYRLPIGNDWLARFEYSPRITGIIYINDHDFDPSAQIYFDELFDITNSLPFAPAVEISYTEGQVYRNLAHARSVDIGFEAIIEDADSDTHSYLWNFGDGEISQENAPLHTFLVEDDHYYTVLLQVSDESGNMGQATVQITVDDGDSSFPLTLNFVGDIMIARRYANAGGIIETGGVESIFEPTIDILGNAADLTIANLECVMTIDGTPHPTKSVVYRGLPEYIPAIAEAGIDVVSLANNHTLDYGLVGLQATQQTLVENNILHYGSGIDSDEAYAPTFTNTKGVSIAWLGNSDRTGQYNNAQPYLNAGFNKPGFAYLTPYYLLQQISAVHDVADLVVMEMHGGSEYSSAPGAGYDSFEFGVGIPAEDWIRPREITRHMDLPGDSDEDENYSPLMDVPHMWDREIRHFAVESGADLVVVHHPHIIQGFEVYNGTLIAHSLGNYVFDLNYHETFPSVVLNAEINEEGFQAFSAVPVYLDDYIPVPALGQLGVYLLDYLATKSRGLDTYLYVDRENTIANIWIDTLSMPRTHIQKRQSFNLELEGSFWVSEPINIHQLGNISSLESPPGIGWEYRLGRELLWYGNMEDEGSSQWNLNSSGEWLDVTEAYSGERSIGQYRSPSSGDNVVTNLENRIRVDASKKHHVAAYIKTQNGSGVTVQVRYYANRTSSTILTTHYLTFGVTGTQDWTYYHKETDPPDNATYFDIRLNSDMPVAGDAYSWFDDVHLIEWTDWDSAPVAEIISPNEYYFLQLRNSSTTPDPNIEFTETVYLDPQPVNVDLIANETVGLVDAEIQFQDASTGPIGWWAWDFGDGQTSMDQNPLHIYPDPGFYDVSLTIIDNFGNYLTETKSDYIRIFTQYLPGDLDFNGQNSISDIIILVNIIIGEIIPTDAQRETADINTDGNVNVQDLILLVNIILFD
ncbi:CapA family protein [bacterium]|nr:CapA family protein [bacterium]